LSRSTPDIEFGCWLRSLDLSQCDRTKRAQSCTRKVKHDQDAAMAEAERACAAYGHGYQAYRCMYCKRWHVGHPERRKG
jgi:hypothetical protein